MKHGVKTYYNDNNFGVLRLLAAVFVLISHSFGVLQKPLEQPALWYNGKNIIFSGVGLSVFFTISGYLVTQSLFNSDSWKHYLWKRFLRVMPALVVANLVCILAGCFITSLPFINYFFSKETGCYLLKNSTLVVNQFYLPGVFTTLKDRTVNASLWTILVEVECYFVLLLGSSYIVTRKWLFLSCFVLFEAVRIYMTVIHDIHIKGVDLYPDFTFGTYFYLGALLYRFKDDIPLRWFYANILLAIAFVNVNTIVEPVTLSIFFSYTILVIGTSKAVIHLKGHDFSYGLYLYAFPVQQLVVMYFGYSINPWLHITLSTVIAFIPAFLSWTFIEKPFLRKKNVFANNRRNTTRRVPTNY